MISLKCLSKQFVPVLIQTAGAHRKPRWLPVAKSKVFRIPKRPEVPEEERLELLRLNNNYKTQMRAIRRFYHDEMIHDQSTRDSASSEMSLRLEAEEWEKCLEINEQWNKQVSTTYLITSRCTPDDDRGPCEEVSISQHYASCHSILTKKYSYCRQVIYVKLQ